MTAIHSSPHADRTGSYRESSNIPRSGVGQAADATRLRLLVEDVFSDPSTVMSVLAPFLDAGSGATSDFLDAPHMQRPARSTAIGNKFDRALALIDHGLASATATAGVSKPLSYLFADPSPQHVPAAWLRELEKIASIEDDDFVLPWNEDDRGV